MQLVSNVAFARPAGPKENAIEEKDEQIVEEKKDTKIEEKEIVNMTGLFDDDEY